MKRIRLTKDQLIAELHRSNLPTSGTAEELRQRLTDYVRRQTDDPSDMTEPRDGVNTRNMAAANQKVTAVAETATTGKIAEKTFVEKADPYRNIDRLRKSGNVTDGKDPLSFLERMAELQDTYDLADADLLRGVPELLRGPAQIWYRNSRAEIKSWDEFSEEFIQVFASNRSRFQRENEARTRRQRANEPFHEFMNSIIMLMRRAQIDDHHRMDLLFENMRTEYRRLIYRPDVKSARDLLARVQQIEQEGAEEGPTERKTVSRAVPLNCAETTEQSIATAEPIEARLARFSTSPGDGQPEGPYHPTTHC